MTPAANSPESRMHSEARNFEFLQWIRLWLRAKVAASREKGVDLLSLLDEGLDIVHSGSIGFAPQDLEQAGMGPNGREELRVHFMGLQGASSPLPAYLV
ncbi:MAG TPA: type VI secretion system baseplate subunit TssG, partial [Fibrobacteria bacterium]|nr:type VI secretion system baseplate subunit TssG [Fibrobacteria bacterium]